MSNERTHERASLFYTVVVVIVLITMGGFFGLGYMTGVAKVDDRTCKGVKGSVHRTILKEQEMIDGLGDSTLFFFYEEGERAAIIHDLHGCIE